MQNKQKLKAGFTLVEMSVVLVIVGFMIAAVYVGRDMLNAAAVRGQIAQIEKYNQAANVFRQKYNFLPGDIPDPYATKNGFKPRGTQPGMGNGDGIIAGFGNPTTIVAGGYQSGEPSMFWVDLSAAGLIDGTFTTATPTLMAPFAAMVTQTSTPNINNYFPVGKVSQNTNVLVWSGGPSAADGQNYFSINNVPELARYSTEYYVETSSGSVYTPVVGLTVAQAYAIDSKVDDGLPQSGKAIAMTPVGQYGVWAGSNNPNSAVLPYTTATARSATSCFDNAGSNGATQQYSMKQSNGSGVNCGISIAFQ